MTPLVDRVSEFFRRHGGGAGVVAISGGPDSVSLAYLAKQLVDRGDLTNVVLAHLNHQLRGPRSDADEGFVVDLAKRWGVPVVTETIDVAALAVGRNLEATARDLRYAWLTQIARDVGAPWVATGHTADDQAETVLHHVLRGSGLTGLAGIAAARPLADGVVLIRPLLDVRRSELLEMLSQANVGFRIDASNVDPRFTRNRLRHEIMPLLEREINAGLTDALGRTAAQARECQAAVTAIAGEYLKDVELPRAGEVLVFSRTTLAERGPFWVREIFRLVWQRERWPMGEMDAEDWRRLERLVDGSLTGHDFPGGVHGRAQRHVVQLRRVG